MNITEQDKTFMREAIRLADESVKNGGGPFGAVIVKDGEIVAGSANSVTRDNDPTAHAEVNTIRQACRKLGTPLYRRASQTGIGRAQGRGERPGELAGAGRLQRHPAVLYLFPSPARPQGQLRARR